MDRLDVGECVNLGAGYSVRRVTAPGTAARLAGGGHRA
jgi:hypothetical protein